MNMRSLLKSSAATVLLCVVVTSPSFGETVDEGEAFTSWLGKGELHEVGDAHVLFHGAVEGVIFIRQRGVVRTPMHAAKMHCPVLMNIDKKTNERSSQGFCVITPHDGEGMVYTEFSCSGPTEECRGQWTHVGGTGKYAGISGTIPFQSRMNAGSKDSGSVTGYAIWENLTYQLP